VGCFTQIHGVSCGFTTILQSCGFADLRRMPVFRHSTLNQGFDPEIRHSTLNQGFDPKDALFRQSQDACFQALDPESGIFLAGSRSLLRIHAKLPSSADSRRILADSHGFSRAVPRDSRQVAKFSRFLPGHAVCWLWRSLRVAAGGNLSSVRAVLPMLPGFGRRLCHAFLRIYEFTVFLRIADLDSAIHAFLRIQVCQSLPILPDSRACYSRSFLWIPQILPSFSRLPKQA
jgi:hypothetical protein